MVLAMSWKISTNSKILRSGFDLAIFPFLEGFNPNSILSTFLLGELHPANSIEYGSRKYLASFRGKQYVPGSRKGNFEIRNRLMSLHDGKQIIVVALCEGGLERKSVAFERQCNQSAILAKEYLFTELIANSTFGLAPRGVGSFSWRMFEYLCRGVIPVVFADTYVFPFNESIDWEKILVKIDENALTSTKERLRAYTNAEIVQMQQRGYEVMRKYIHFSHTVTTALEIFQTRVQGLIAFQREATELEIEEDFGYS